MDRMMLDIESAPEWGKLIGAIAGALGLRELISAWQKRSFKNEDDKDAVIKELRKENNELKGEIGDFKAEMTGIKKAVAAIIDMIQDESTRKALKKILADD